MTAKTEGRNDKLRAAHVDDENDPKITALSAMRVASATAVADDRLARQSRLQSRRERLRDDLTPKGTGCGTGSSLAPLRA